MNTPTLCVLASLSMSALIGGPRPADGQERGDGQETVRSAVMQVDLTGTDGVARIRIEYEVSGSEAGGTLPATLLVFGDAEPAAASAPGIGPLGFVAGPGRARRLDVPVQSTAEGQRVAVEYSVPRPVADGAGRMRGHLPVLSLDRAPEAAHPGLFHAVVLLPASWHVGETFPSGLAPVGDAAEGVQAYEVDLPVVPSTLSFRASAQRGWLPALPLTLDVLAAAIILAFGAVGWRRIREDEK